MRVPFTRFATGQPPNSMAKHSAVVYLMAFIGLVVAYPTIASAESDKGGE
jgi:hypothetical protein